MSELTAMMSPEGVPSLATMVLEHAILPVRPGLEAEFEDAFALARPLITGMPGFVSLSVSRSVESPNLYLLLVEWDSIEAHTEGFRGSEEYAQWRALLHHFYEPFPVVEHFRQVL
jgi:heme-degrading monooxygenase HmoA